MTMRVRIAVIVVLGVAACRAAEPMQSDADTSGSADTTTTTSTATSTDTSSTEGTATSESTSTTEALDSSDTGPMPPPPKSCALEVIDPSTDPTMVVDAGDGDGQIPTAIGDALVRNCGCHYTDNVTPGQYVDYKSNKVPMATLADFHVDFMGTFPMGFETMPVYLAVEQRVVHHEPLPMPPHGCGVEGETGAITMADLELFTQWLAAGSPDGASFP